MDEFYPISPKQHNSFYNYVNENYIKGFDLDPNRALFINCDDIKLYNNKSYNEIFPNCQALNLVLRGKAFISDPTLNILTSRRGMHGLSDYLRPGLRMQKENTNIHQKDKMVCSWCDFCDFGTDIHFTDRTAMVAGFTFTRK